VFFAHDSQQWCERPVRLHASKTKAAGDIVMRLVIESCRLLYNALWLGILSSIEVKFLLVTGWRWICRRMQLKQCERPEPCKIELEYPPMTPMPRHNIDAF